jgi:hypothetical protein
MQCAPLLREVVTWLGLIGFAALRRRTSTLVIKHASASISNRYTFVITQASPLIDAPQLPIQ